MDDPRIDRRLAFNPNMDWEGLTALLDRQPTRADRLHVFNGMCMNRASADRLADLYERSRKLPAADRRMAWTCMAKNRRLDPHVAHRMALALGTGRTTGDASIAATLACNPNTAGETLALLADKYPDDRYLLALVIDNPNVTDFERRLVAGGTADPATRQWAWRSMSEPESLMKADVTDRDTLIGACLNPHIDERAAARLARDGGGVAVGYLRDNEALDPVFRDMLDDM